MHRRRFFNPPPLIQTAGAVLAPFADPDNVPPPPGEFALVRVSRRAMATTFEVAIPYGRPDAVPAAEDALALIDELEDQMTVYRDHSEVSRLNSSAAAGPVVVEDQLFDLFTSCAAWTRETDGAFDIATGAVIKAWGFYRREGRVPTPKEQAAAMARTGMRHVILHAAARAVKYRVPGVELNLGAVGKGYALDRAAELLRSRWGIDSALLHGGGSSVYAIGRPPGDPRGWGVRLKHPWAEGRSLGTVWLADAGLGTSAATFQYFEYNGRKLGHLLDPRTGRPAEGTASASVCAPTAAEADAMSTALFVLGAAGADRLTRTRPRLSAVVLSENPYPSPLSFSGKRGGGLGPGRNPSPGASPKKGGEEEAGGFAPPSLLGKGVGGLGSSDLSTYNLGPTTYSPPGTAPSDCYP
ncbi:MAG: apbE 2 [Gemmataceae bacterium]|nr:apbE 2 [Gemmataceae bacterium]